MLTLMLLCCDIAAAELTGLVLSLFMLLPGGIYMLIHALYNVGEMWWSGSVHHSCDTSSRHNYRAR